MKQTQSYTLKIDRSLMECLIQKWLVWIVVVWFMLLGLGRWSDGCLEQEKAVLLQLKPFFYNVDGVNKWGQAVEGNCCEWERVECNPTTRRVIHLFLNQSTFYMDNDIIYSDIPNYYIDTDVYQIIPRDDWYLNASLFLPFQELKSLYLSGNSIAGCLPYHGFERLSLLLDKLEILDLNYNRLHESILPSLSQLSSLKSLYLGYNRLESLGSFHGLINLEVLDVTGNLFNDNILSFLGRLSNLKTLSFGGNLNGSIDFRELESLSKLEELHISCNFQYFFPPGIKGFPPQEIKACTIPLQSLDMLPVSLRSIRLNGFSFNQIMTIQNNERELGLINLEVLDLSHNRFNGNVLPYLGRLSNLKTLSFGGNLNGAIDFRELESLSKLEELHIFCNFQYFFPPQEMKACTIPLQSLDMLPVSLRSIRLNGFSFIQTMTIQNNGRELGLINLEVLDLSHNRFNGSVLPYLGRLSNLKSLSLGENLKGSLDCGELDALSNLEQLYIACDDYFYNFSGPKACSLQLQSLGLFASLKTFVSFGVNFDRAMTIHELHKLTSLEELHLVFSSLPSNFFQVVGTMPSLKRWEMNDCEVNGNGLLINGLKPSIIYITRFCPVRATLRGGSGHKIVFNL